MASSRRELFRHLVGEVAQRAEARATPIVAAAGGRGATTGQQARAHAVVPERVASPIGLEDVRRLAGEHGLAAVADDVVRLARATVRLAADPDREAKGPVSRLFAPPSAGDGEVVIAVLEHDVLATAGLAGPLEARTLSLSVRVPESAIEHELGLLVCGPATVTVGSPATPAEGTALPELALPRVWSAPVQALDLDQDATAAWESLRRAMAMAQGVAHPDDAAVAHRVLGYPDERRGLMPAICAEVVGGRTGEEGGAAEHWRLLLQVSTSGVAPEALSGYERVYLWITEGALARGEMSSVVALAQ